MLLGDKGWRILLEDGRCRASRCLCHRPNPPSMEGRLACPNMGLEMRDTGLHGLA